MIIDNDISIDTVLTIIDANVMATAAIILLQHMFHSLISSKKRDKFQNSR